MLKCHNSSASNSYQTLSEHYQISARNFFQAKTIVVLVACFSQRPKLRWLPHIDVGRPPLTGPYGLVQVHTEEKIHADLFKYMPFLASQMHGILLLAHLGLSFFMSLISTRRDV
jgi:hypothetical protein